MILDLFLNLIDRCLQLLQVRKTIRVNLFQDYVEPIYSSFDSLHSDYLEAFEKYRESISNSTSLDSGHPVFDLIMKDHVFSKGFRGKLNAMLGNSHDVLDKKRINNLDKFIAGIMSYFVWTRFHVFPDKEILMEHNDPRANLIFGLKHIFSADQRYILRFISISYTNEF